MSETCNILGAVFGPSEAVDQINDKGYAEYTQMAYTHCLESLPNILPNDVPIDVPGRGQLFMAERLRQSVGNVLAQLGHRCRQWRDPGPGQSLDRNPSQE